MLQRPPLVQCGLWLTYAGVATAARLGTGDPGEEDPQLGVEQGYVLPPENLMMAAILKVSSKVGSFPLLT